MKRYQFGLEPLLFQRQTLEEQTQQEMGRAQALLQALQQELEAAFQTYRTHVDTPIRSGMTPAEIRLHTNYTSILLENLERCKRKVRDQRKAVDQIRERLQAQHMDTQVVETLKEKDMARYSLELRRHESRLLDEFTSIRHSLKTIKSE